VATQTNQKRNNGCRSGWQWRNNRRRYRLQSFGTSCILGLLEPPSIDRLLILYLRTDFRLTMGVCLCKQETRVEDSSRYFLTRHVQASFRKRIRTQSRSFWVVPSAAQHCRFLACYIAKILAIYSAINPYEGRICGSHNRPDPGGYEITILHRGPSNTKLKTSELGYP
jgi:hypothetical protein